MHMHSYYLSIKSKIKFKIKNKLKKLPKDENNGEVTSVFSHLQKETTS
jgi:hypothetical protein